MTPDQTADLWLKIDQLHLNYLKSEENTSKLEIRKKLEGCVHQYLCLVPQDRKFCNALTSVIVFESARWVTDFSALKAARAFEAIEKYAANLINQPWRKEFKEIKQFGGFYKHQVESALNSPERLFHLMGYVSSGQQSMVLEGPVELDKVTVVARDCLLAFVECQIIVTILQGVTAQFPCRWDEVLEFRRSHIGTPEQATRTLLYQKNQLHFAQAHHAAAAGYPQGYYPYAPYAPMTYSNGAGGYMPPGAVPPPPPGYLGNPGVVPTAKLVDLSNTGTPSSNSLPILHQNGNGIKKNGLHDETGHNSSASSTSTLTGQRGPIPLTIKTLEAENKRKTLLAEAAAAAAGANEAKNPLESWDYVYRQLESIGYTKDQGERPDVLDILSKVGMNPQHRKQLEQRLREQQQNSLHHQRQPSSSPEPVKPAPKVKSSRVDPWGDKNHIQSTRRQESPSPPPAIPVKSGRRSRQQQPPQQPEIPPKLPEKAPKLPEKRKPPAPAPAPPPQVHNQDYDESDEEDFEEYDADDMVDESKEWQCLFCTYLNSLEVDICEMCAKSRQSVASSHDDEEFVSGNSQMDDPNTYESEIEYPDTDPHADQENLQDKIQCPKCTLFNPSDLKVCAICGASLHKAPISNGTALGGTKMRNGRPQSSASKSSGHSRNRNR